MDELMVNSAAVHKVIIEEVLNKYSASLYNPKNHLTKAEEARWYGMKITDIFAFLAKKYQLEDRVTADQLNNEFNMWLLPIFGQKVEVMPGVTELVQFVKGKYKLAVASSAPFTKINIVLRKLALAGTFDAVVSGENMHLKGKPAPDIFLAAAKKLKIEPRNFLVLEDAKNGVEAAKNAGMYCIGVHNKFTFETVGKKQNLSKADWEVESLHEVIPLLDKNRR